jgi:predicted alpha/beta-fold hydrolase
MAPESEFERLDRAIPPFEPHPWFRSGHAQTIVGRYWPSGRTRLRSVAHEVDVDRGDRLSVLESTPESWGAGGPAAVLVHGLAGSAQSPYVVRVAARLFGLGARVVRMNLRGAGSGFGLARGIYHAGRTEDVRRVVEWISNRAPASPIALIGFSLGANLALKLAAEAAADPLAGLDCVLAANPPIDLAACARHIQKPEHRIYDRNFVRLLRAEVARLHKVFPDLGSADLSGVRTLLDFDELYTAPRNGFSGAADYYARSSAGPLISWIKVPGLVVHAQDDPFIPAEAFLESDFPSRLALEMIPSGGHLGYLSRNTWGGDRRWLDGRLAAWLTSRWEENAPNRAGVSCDRATLRRCQGGEHCHA